MTAIPGYRQLEPLFEGPRSAVFRARRVRDGQPVIVKVMNRRGRDARDEASYHREYHILNHLRGVSAAVAAHDLKRSQDSLLLELEEFGGDSLEKHLQERPFDLPEALGTALALIAAVAEIHAAGVTHNAITPVHIILNRRSGKVKLTCFAAATLHSLENPIQPSPNELAGALPYISPEQTGRMNRKVDFRSDFYSFGVIVHQLLAGRPPFVSADPMEVVHCHLAIRPPLLHELNPAIPEPLALVVAKLLAKDPEDRYQSAWGIHEDLDACLSQWLANGRIAPFALAQQDFPERFIIPDRIYGREAQVQELLEAFQSVSGGGRTLMLVHGYSGAGKSCLVREITKPITRRRGFFLSGKHDQFKRNIPYSAFIGAFAGMVRLLLTSDEARLAEWRDKLLAAWGPNGGIITAVLPEMELVVGPQAPVAELPPLEARNRFNRVFLEFIRVFCQPEHPLVIFLDDLQWADAATLKLLEILMTAEGIGHLFVIGAYRDNEVEPTHPLHLTLDKLTREWGGLRQIALTPLDTGPIIDLLADTLHRERAELRPLAELVARKTAGNPFFVNQFLTTLHQEGLLSLQAGQPGAGRQWRWDVAEIARLDFTENVVDLVITKLLRLPDETRRILRLAACVGSRFDLDTLAIIHRQPQAAINDHLVPAVQQGFVLTLSDPDLVGQGQESRLLVRNYRFLHDRVQQAAYALIDDADKQTVHLAIGRLLAERFGPDSAAERLFELTDHYNKGRHLLQTAEERLRLLEFNLKACLRAKSAIAYDSALQYLATAQELCPLARPPDNDLPFRLWREQAELEYLNGLYPQAAQSLQRALALAGSLLAEVEIHNLRIVQSTMLGQHQEAIAIGALALALLGIELPQSELKQAIHQELDGIYAALGERAIASLIDAPPMTQPEQQAAMKLLNDLTPAAYFHDTELYSWILARMGNLSLRHGHIAESGKGYTSLGNVLIYERGAFREGYEFGLLGLRLCEAFNHPGYVCRCSFVATAFLLHWVRPIAESAAMGEEGYRTALESGEFLYAGYILAFNNALNGFFQGRNLAQLQQEVDQRLPFVHKTNNRLARDLMTALRAAMHTLGDPAAPAPAPPDDGASPTVTGVWQVLQSMLAYLNGDFAASLYAARLATERQSFLSGTIASVYHLYFLALALAATPPETPGRAARRRELATHLETLGRWAAACPENFAHQHLLVQAEAHRLDEQPALAMERYDQAIAMAARNGFGHDQALANELAARFWQARGKPEFAHLYLTQAWREYRAWGAWQQAERLQKMDPALQPEAEPAASGDAGLHGEDFLDLRSVLKASQAISGEIVLERLLDRLMTIVMEGAGAELGSLILLRDERLLVEMSARVGSPLQRPQVPVENYDQLPDAIVRYVARTQQPLLMDDANQDPLFAQDPYIVQFQPRSILCLPILGRGRLSGLLYLENNQTSGAFTAGRVELLKIIAAQAAISLENAQFLASLTASEVKYRLLYENALEGIIVLTPDGRLRAANPAAARTLGYPGPQALLDSPDNAANALFTDEGERDRLLALLAAHGQAADFETLWRGHDGSPVWVSLSLQAVHDPTGGARCEGFLLDIAARKEKEEAERERQKAEAATQAKSQFLANMSHEIRTPMNAILGMTHLAMKTALTDQQRDYLGKIRGASDHLLGVINDILDFSKVEAGKLTLEKVSFDLERVLESLSNLFADKAHEKGLEFLLSCPPELATFLIGDPVRLSQVLTNLTGNAIKFTAHGQVIVSVETVAAGSETLTLRFAVRDSGIGLSEEERGRLFQSFSQADLSTTRKFGGTGLGLAISKKLVELMEGEIGVDSQPGQGSTFHFTATFGRDLAPHAHRMPARELAGLRVLVVDDSPEAREIMHDLLKGFALHATTVASGEEALKEMRRVERLPGAHPYDLVLMDWRMPGLDGLETTRRIRSDPHIKRIPTVFMVTAHSLGDLRQEATRAGVESFLIKPVRPSSLLDAITAIFGRDALHASVAPSRAPERTEHSFTGLHILLAEDNPINQIVARELLECVGITVSIAEDGGQAVAMAKELPCHLVLMDIQMPVLDGYEAAQAIRRDATLDHKPIIAMTAHAMTGERERCLASGMNDHLAKPIDPELLYATIAKWAPPECLAPVATLQPIAAPEVAPAPPAGALPGVRLETLLSKLQADQRLLQLLLTTFYDNYHDAAQRLRAMLDAGQRDEAKRLTHTLKGVAGNLEAHPLFPLVKELEAALLNQSDPLPPFQRFEAALTTLLAGIAAFLGQSAPTAASAPRPRDLEALPPLLRELQRRLTHNDPTAMDLTPALEQALGSAPPAGFTQLVQQVEGYDFEPALTTLAALQAILREESP